MSMKKVLFSLALILCSVFGYSLQTLHLYPSSGDWVEKIKNVADDTRIIFHEGRYQGVVDLTDKKNIILEGQGEVLIYVEETYETIVYIAECRNITLKNLSIRHVPVTQIDGCSGDVISASGSKKILIEKCHLNGCGATGLTASECEDVSLRDCLIDENSYCALYFTETRNILLEKNTIRDNADGIYISVLETYLQEERNFSEIGLVMRDNTLVNNQMAAQLHNEAESDAAYQSGYDEGYEKGFQDGYQQAQQEFYGQEGDNPEGDYEESSDSQESYYMKLLEEESQRYTDIYGPEGYQSQDPAVYARYYKSNTLMLDPQMPWEGIIYHAPDNTKFIFSEGKYRGSIIFDQKQNLEFTGKGDVSIVTVYNFNRVVSFDSSKNIRFKNIRFTHDPAINRGEYHCYAEVVGIEESSQIRFDSCRMDGCGTVGVSSYQSSDVEIRNCEVYNNSESAMSLYNVRDFKVINCRIHDNADGIKAYNEDNEEGVSIYSDSNSYDRSLGLTLQGNTWQANTPGPEEGY